MALSTTEAKYMVTAEVRKEIIWMKEFIRELGIRQEEFRLYCDNLSAIHLAKNVDYHSRTKHTTENGSDMLMKVLSAKKLNTCGQRVGLGKNPMPG